MAQQKSIHCPETQHIIRLVAYFDVFQHPLRVAELAQLTGYSIATIRARISENSHILIAADTYVWLKKSVPIWSQVESKRARATRHWPQALRYGRHLSKLPFVRGVFLTGSMSKSAVDEDSDFDYLLVVDSGRVWLVKTLLEFFRKPMSQFRRECYCANYIVGMDTLTLVHRNVFTAIELSTAIPLFGTEACTAFVQANTWTKHFVPNHQFVMDRAKLVPSIPVVRKTSRFFDHLDEKALGVWNHYWNRKYSDLSEDIREKRFRREPGKAANHLHDFQDRVIEALDATLDELGYLETLVL